MRIAQPNFFLQFDRMGINPFEDRFEVTLRLEGTVRGTGGIRIIDETCATSVPGLFAAGDAATRELICGGFTGGEATMRHGPFPLAIGPGKQQRSMPFPLIEIIWIEPCQENMSLE